MPGSDVVRLIVKKRDGLHLSTDEMESLIRQFVSGEVADYQMSAFLMAALLRGLDDTETIALTEAMLRSGDVLRLSSVRAPKIDKHSTGGVGDKISLCLGPLVAACGVAVPMIAGRGLGHTGGTLDKLEAIPGYSTRLGPREFERVVRRVGVSITGQTERLVPADRALYALRDVTGTVESIPLIVSSILSKKIAAGLDGLVLDVKAGRGAFMKDLGAARELARALVRVGRRAGKKVVAVLTDMSAPIGRSIGNALEVREAVGVLNGGGPEDTVELTLGLGIEMLLLGGVERTRAAARRRLSDALASGAGLDRLRRMIEAHGGDARVVDEPGRLPRAPRRIPVVAPRGGVVQTIDALELGLVAASLGAGRSRTDQSVDHAVGIELAVQIGARVERGQPLAWLHARGGRGLEQWVDRARAAFALGATACRPPKRILERLTR